MTCVYCRAEPVSPVYHPFCSERCKMADLGRWLNGDYAVPARPDPNAPDADDQHSTDIPDEDL